MRFSTQMPQDWGRPPPRAGGRISENELNYKAVETGPDETVAHHRAGEFDQGQECLPLPIPLVFLPSPALKPLPITQRDDNLSPVACMRNEGDLLAAAYYWLAYTVHNEL